MSNNQDHGISKLKHFLIGQPLRNEAEQGEKIGVLWGLPVLSSDAVSSVAYSAPAILIVLIPAIGAAAYLLMGFITVAIIVLLLLLVLSYRMIIDRYPGGGGAFIVAKENLGIGAGVIVGAALAIDYTMTLAVSISSGVEQLTSAFPILRTNSLPVILAVVFVLAIMTGNLRGVRESSRIFGIPTYLFVAGMLIMIAYGIIKVGLLGYIPPKPEFKDSDLLQPITMLLILKAFSNGCTALTGVEAVSDAVPNFRAPAQKNAKRVLALLAIIILALVGGSAILANMYPVDPTDPANGGALLVLIAQQIFGNTFMYYYLTFTTLAILVMAANTAFAGFPILVSIMAGEGYMPRQLRTRGDRLSYSNGILALSVMAIVLIIVFQAQVSKLLGLYAVGVFLSFTLAQAGMLRLWLRERTGKWKSGVVINGLGTIVTAAVVVIVAFSKFSEGSWIVVVAIPAMTYGMMRIKRHYNSVREQLRIEWENYKPPESGSGIYHDHIIVLVAGVNKSSLRAMKYARTIAGTLADVVCFSVATTRADADELREKYDQLGSDIPLIIRYSPYRKVVEPLLSYIDSRELKREDGDLITVVVPNFIVARPWQRILHNNIRRRIERELLKHKHITVAIMPLQLKETTKEHEKTARDRKAQKEEIIPKKPNDAVPDKADKAPQDVDAEK
ncbi:MAG: APC family permease [Clostridiales bacterium]|nr:APC family permease [Clostridiales bacterium]